MENYCMNCIMYMYEQNLLSAGECMNCHEKKCNIQFLDGIFGAKCDACGMTCVADLNTICELDDTEYKIYYIPMEYGITELKKILHHVSDNVYKIKKDTEMGNLIVAGRLYQVVPTIKWLMEEKILFHVTPENPLERYDYWKKCRYAYFSFRELK